MPPAATLAPERLLTIDEYLALPPNGKLTELVRGRIVEMNPPYAWHGFVCANVTAILKQFADEHHLGTVVGNDSGVVTEKDPDTLRGADVSYYSFERVPREAIKQRGYPAMAPDLVVEVRSPFDRWKNLFAKVAEYLNAGVLVVLVLDPERSAVTVYQPDQPETTLTAEQELNLPTVLPGFAVRVGRFFE